MKALQSLKFQQPIYLWTWHNKPEDLNLPYLVARLHFPTDTTYTKVCWIVRCIGIPHYRLGTWKPWFTCQSTYLLLESKYGSVIRFSWNIYTKGMMPVLRVFTLLKKVRYCVTEEIIPLFMINNFHALLPQNWLLQTLDVCLCVVNYVWCYSFITGRTSFQN
jgi:hypothetical protein